jgi:Zn-dependent metalloprotease
VPPAGKPGSSVFGHLAPARAQVSERSARDFLATRLAAASADLVLVRDVRSPMGRHFTFQQHVLGVAVEGARVAVHYDRQGRVVALNDAYRPGLFLDSSEPAVSATGAAEIAGRAAGPRAAVALLGAAPFSRARLVVTAPEGVARLAWRIDTAGDGESWTALVDALTGEVLEPPHDVNRYVDGTGRVFLVNAVVSTRDNSLTDQNDSAAAVPASAYAVVPLRGLLGNGFLDGPFASSSRTKKRVSSPTHTFVFDRSSDGFSETEGYYAFDYAQRYIQGLGFTNVNNRQQVFSVNRFKQDNSFYSPNSKEITLGLGGVDDAEDADVIWHEYGHSIQDDQQPGFGPGPESGAMGEGFGDYWAGTLGAQLSGGFQDTCLAEWDATSYSPTSPPCLRRLDGTKHYPEDVAGEVHDDGEIWSAALWQIRGAIGATRADRLVLQHHFLVGTDPSFNEAANALVTAALALGYTNQQVNSIRTILRNRGFTVTV